MSNEEVSDELSDEKLDRLIKKATLDNLRLDHELKEKELQRSRWVAYAEIVKSLGAIGAITLSVIGLVLKATGVI